VINFHKFLAFQNPVVIGANDLVNIIFVICDVLYCNTNFNIIILVSVGSNCNTLQTWIKYAQMIEETLNIKCRTCVQTTVGQRRM
jgi:hypothetical protein